MPAQTASTPMTNELNVYKPAWLKLPCSINEKVSKLKEDSTSKVSEKRFENVIAIPSPKSQICDLSELEDDLRMKQFNLKNDENGGERK